MSINSQSGSPNQSTGPTYNNKDPVDCVRNGEPISRYFDQASLAIARNPQLRNNQRNVDTLVAISAIAAVHEANLPNQEKGAVEIEAARWITKKHGFAAGYSFLAVSAGINEVPFTRSLYGKQSTEFSRLLNNRSQNLTPQNVESTLRLGAHSKFVNEYWPRVTTVPADPAFIERMKQAGTAQAAAELLARDTQSQLNSQLDKIPKDAVPDVIKAGLSALLKLPIATIFPGDDTAFNQMNVRILKQIYYTELLQANPGDDKTWIQSIERHIQTVANAVENMPISQAQADAIKRQAEQGFQTVKAAGQAKVLQLLPKIVRVTSLLNKTGLVRPITRFVTLQSLAAVHNASTYIGKYSHLEANGITNEQMQAVVDKASSIADGARNLAGQARDRVTQGTDQAVRRISQTLLKKNPNGLPEPGATDSDEFF